MGNHSGLPFFWLYTKQSPSFPSPQMYDKNHKPGANKKSIRVHKKKLAEVERIKKILQKIPSPGGLNIQPELHLQNKSDANPIGNNQIVWADLPIICDPIRSKMYRSANESRNTRRGIKKRYQIESYASLLRYFVKTIRKTSAQKIHIVDFGCGSGSLTLALAYLFREDCLFTAVDMKAHALEILRKKSDVLGLTNLKCQQTMIEHFTTDTPVDLILSLHGCGNATDYSILQAIHYRAAYLVCPCCIGKLKFSIQGGSSFSKTHKKYWNHTQHSRAVHLPQNLCHPRSEWMRKFIDTNTFLALAKAGDISHGEQQTNVKQRQKHWYEGIARVCKLNIEFDRNKHAEEQNYRSKIYHLSHAKHLAKSHLLIGIPNDQPLWTDIHI